MERQRHRHRQRQRELLKRGPSVNRKDVKGNNIFHLMKLVLKLSGCL